MKHLSVANSMSEIVSVCLQNMKDLHYHRAGSLQLSIIIQLLPCRNLPLNHTITLIRS